MYKKSIKIDLRSGLTKDFFNECSNLYKEVLNELPLNDFDIMISDAKKYEIATLEKIQLATLETELEEMLNRTFEYFKDRRIENNREVLSFEIQVSNYSNIKNCFGKIDFHIWTKQLNLATGTGQEYISIYLFKEQEMLDSFNNELSSLNLNKEQLDYMINQYSELNPTYRRLSNVDDFLIQDINREIELQLDNLDYDENIEFNKDYILDILFKSNDTVVKLFKDKVKVEEIYENDDITYINVTLFDTSNSILFKNKWIKYEDLEVVVNF